MTIRISPDAPILIAASKVSDADLLRRLLDADFTNIAHSTDPDPDQLIADFDKAPADVIILAYETLEKSEGAYLSLYRHSSKIAVHPHRTIVLCNNNNARQTYLACRRQLFDDYVLFWPMNYDSQRLAMSIYLALRELKGHKENGPSSAQFAVQARKLADMESMLNASIASGGERAERAEQSLENAEREIGRVLDQLFRRAALGELSSVLEIKDPAALARVIESFKEKDIHDPLHAVGKTIASLKQFGTELQQKMQPHLDLVKTLGTMAEQVKSTILIVDDDEFMCQMLTRILEAEGYQTTQARSGMEALNAIRNEPPDLIVMDVVMPNINGIEIVKRLKTIPALATIPIVMVTGQSETGVVKESLKAGAVDLVVKPIDRVTFLNKVARALHQ